MHKNPFPDNQPNSIASIQTMCVASTISNKLEIHRSRIYVRNLPIKQFDLRQLKPQ